MIDDLADNNWCSGWWWLLLRLLIIDVQADDETSSQLHDAAAVSLPPEIPGLVVRALYHILTTGTVTLFIV